MSKNPRNTRLQQIRGEQSTCYIAAPERNLAGIGSFVKELKNIFAKSMLLKIN